MFRMNVYFYEIRINVNTILPTTNKNKTDESPVLIFSLRKKELINT